MHHPERELDRGRGAQLIRGLWEARPCGGGVAVAVEAHQEEAAILKEQRYAVRAERPQPVCIHAGSRQAGRGLPQHRERMKDWWLRHRGSRAGPAMHVHGGEALVEEALVEERTARRRGTERGGERGGGGGGGGWDGGRVEGEWAGGYRTPAKPHLPQRAQPPNVSPSPSPSPYTATVTVTVTLHRHPSPSPYTVALHQRRRLLGHR